MGFKGRGRGKIHTAKSYGCRTLSAEKSKKGKKGTAGGLRFTKGWEPWGKRPEKEQKKQ